MRLFEFITEDISSNEATRNIADILTTQLPDLYRKLSKMAENYADNHGEIDKGFRFIAGGQRAAWYNDVFFKHLKPSLYTLTKKLHPSVTADLKEFLNNMIEIKSMAAIENQLPDILIDIGRATKNKQITDAAVSAKSAYEGYLKYIEKLNSGADEEPAAKQKEKQPNIVSAQNTEVERIVNDVLSRIDRNSAGEIRNVLARSDNKLATLQQELSRRNLRP